MNLRTLALGLMIFICEGVFVIHAGASESGNVIPFQINIQTQPFQVMGTAELDLFELTLSKNKLEYIPINVPGFNDYYKSGLVLVAGDGSIIGYVVAGGRPVGTQWKLAFDVAMKASQRQRLLRLVTPYIQKSMQSLEIEWAHLQRSTGAPAKPLPVVVDFLEPDVLARRWALDLFGKYPQAVMEDTSKGTSLSFERIRSLLPPETPRPSNTGTPVVNGYVFGRIYSPNLNRYIEFRGDQLEILDTKSGNVIGKLTLPQVGAPKIQFESTQIVLDYGPGEKRYHYGTGKFTLMYSYENWRAPTRPGSMQRTCREVFVR